MGQTGQRLLTATEKIYESWVGLKKLVVCSGLITLILQNLPKRYLTCGDRSTLQMRYPLCAMFSVTATRCSAVQGLSCGNLHEKKLNFQQNFGSLQVFMILRIDRLFPIFFNHMSQCGCIRIVPLLKYLQFTLIVYIHLINVLTSLHLQKKKPFNLIFYLHFIVLCK